jgi:hypothetical protein
VRIVTDDEDIKPLGEEAEEEVLPRVPDHSMSDEEVESLPIEYSTRAPDDYVVSGPLPHGNGPGHRFSSVAAALIWLTRRVGGERIKQRITEAEEGGRWAFLVSPKRG